MLNKFLLSIKKDLQERRRKIKKHLEQVAVKSSRNKSDYEAKFPDYGRADDENAEEVAAFVDSLSLEKNLETSLKEIELSLKKISKDQYGICEDCGQKITRKRLKILPTARYCLVCKDKNHGTR